MWIPLPVNCCEYLHSPFYKSVNTITHVLYIYLSTPSPNWYHPSVISQQFWTVLSQKAIRDFFEGSRPPIVVSDEDCILWGEKPVENAFWLLQKSGDVLINTSREGGGAGPTVPPQRSRPAQRWNLQQNMYSIGFLTIFFFWGGVVINSVE